MELTTSAMVFAAFLWWFSTGVIFYLNAREEYTFRWSMMGGSLMLIAALYGIWASAQTESVAASFISFSCGLVIWGWHAMSYYMGFITGPRRTHCPEDCRGFERFWRAAETGLYHEAAIVVTVALMIGLTWQQ
ncbi:MAG: DUF3623 family protein, partial [Pseudomonadota bacterium]